MEKLPTVRTVEIEKK